MSKFKKGSIQRGAMELKRHLFSERVCFGDHVVFGWTDPDNTSKIKGNISDPKPR